MARKRGDMHEKKFSKGEAIRFGWNTTLANAGFFVGVFLLAWFIGMSLNVMQEITKDKYPLFSFSVALGAIFMNGLFSVGFTKIGLKFCDQEKGSVQDLFAYPHLFLKYVFASILYGLAIMGGLICLIVPGIILMVRLQFFLYLIVDRNFGIMESLKKSFAMTKGQTGELFLFGLLCLLINLGGLICLFIGLLVTVPTTLLAQAFVFQKLLATVTEEVVMPGTILQN